MPAETSAPVCGCASPPIKRTASRRASRRSIPFRRFRYCRRISAAAARYAKAAPSRCRPGDVVPRCRVGYAQPSRKKVGPEICAHRIKPTNVNLCHFIFDFAWSSVSKMQMAIEADIDNLFTGRVQTFARLCKRLFLQFGHKPGRVSETAVRSLISLFLNSCYFSARNGESGQCFVRPT